MIEEKSYASITKTGEIAYIRGVDSAYVKEIKSYLTKTFSTELSFI